MTDYSANTARALLYIDKVKTDLGVLSFNGEEKLGEHFKFEIEIVCSSYLDTGDLVQEQAQLEFMDRQDKRRVYGVIESVTQQESGLQDCFLYQLVLVPVTKRMNLSIDYRIYQNKPPQEVIRWVLRGVPLHPLAIEYELTQNYDPLEYTVQYGESDWDFACRILSEHGMHVHLRHSLQNQTLVIADDPSSFQMLPRALPYKPSTGSKTDHESIYDLEFSHEVGSGKFEHKGYNFQKPRLNIQSQLEEGDPKEVALRQFDYRGQRYKTNAEAQKAIRHQMEGARAALSTVMGRTDSVTLQPGHKLKITEHDSPEVATISWLILSVKHTLRQPGALEPYVSSASGEGDESGFSYHCDFILSDSAKAWRIPVRQRPFAHNDTAVVVGPPGEDVYCDEFGRVKVHFHWDHEGQKDGNDSCWLRVLQPWAGQGYGAQYIPRVGDEVLVGHFQGDPNQPFVRASLYNAVNTPPWELPKHKARSGIKTASIPGRDKHHEFRMDDSKGKEQLYIHSSKDMDTLVQNDLREQVRGDSHQLIGEDQHIEVKGDAHTTIEGNSITHVEEDSHSVVEGSRETQIGESLFIEAKEISLNTGQKLILEAGSELVLKSGENFISLGPDGMRIQGKDVYYNSGGEPIEPEPAVPEKAIPACEPDSANEGKVAKAHAHTKAQLMNIVDSAYSDLGLSTLTPTRPFKRQKKTPYRAEFSMVYPDLEQTPAAGAPFRVEFQDAAKTVVTGTLDKEGKGIVEAPEAAPAKIQFYEKGDREKADKELKSKYKQLDNAVLAAAKEFADKAVETQKNKPKPKISKLFKQEVEQKLAAMKAEKDKFDHLDFFEKSWAMAKAGATGVGNGFAEYIPDFGELGELMDKMDIDMDLMVKAIALGDVDELEKAFQEWKDRTEAGYEEMTESMEILILILKDEECRRTLASLPMRVLEAMPPDQIVEITASQGTQWGIDGAFVSASTALGTLAGGVGGPIAGGAATGVVSARRGGNAVANISDVLMELIVLLRKYAGEQEQAFIGNRTYNTRPERSAQSSGSKENPKTYKCKWSNCKGNHKKVIRYPKGGTAKRKSGFDKKWVAAGIEPWMLHGPGENTYPTSDEYFAELRTKSSGNRRKCNTYANYEHPMYATQKHHALPVSSFKDFPILRKNINLIGYNVNHHKNGICLPTFTIDIPRHDLQCHRGPHPALYFDKISKRLQDIESETENYCHKDIQGNMSYQKALVDDLNEESEEVIGLIRHWEYLLRSNAHEDRKSSEARLKNISKKDND